MSALMLVRSRVTAGRGRCSAANIRPFLVRNSPLLGVVFNKQSFPIGVGKHQSWPYMCAVPITCIRAVVSTFSVSPITAQPSSVPWHRGAMPALGHRSL